MTDYQSIVKQELGMNLSGASTGPAPSQQSPPQGGPIPMNNSACAPDEVEFPVGGGTNLDQLYSRVDDPREMPRSQQSMPPTYRDLPIHPIMQQALYDAHHTKDPVLTDEQRTALLVLALSVAIGSPYAQGRLRDFLPPWMTVSEGEVTWPRAFVQGSLVASAFFLLRRYLLKKQG